MCPLSRGWLPSAQCSVWFSFWSCFSTLRPKFNTFRIPRKCYFRANFAVCPVIYFHHCSFIKLWVGHFKIQGEINLDRINNTVEPWYNKHGLYLIHRYRTLVSDHKSTLCQLFCLLRTSNFKFCLKKIWLHGESNPGRPLHYARLDWYKVFLHHNKRRQQAIFSSNLIG